MFDRIWDNRDNEIKRDDRNNELRPVQIEKPKWILEPMGDRTGYLPIRICFTFDKGEHIISLAAVREPMAADCMELYREEEVKTYEEIKKEYEENGLKPTKHHLIKKSRLRMR